ncbi:MAG: hypothetical protein M1837_004742 [Sclerophora amabilis]|nr:MAG: hypothetical protein M1837_004742 [Sclerophora amabilis]
MFSPDTSLRASATTLRRNPRRRQRTYSDESGTSQPKAKRQRAGLRNGTFEDPSAANHDADGTLQLNGSAHREQRDASSETRDLPVRAAKKGGERGRDGDGSVTLTRNERYAATKLPALPDRIRNNHARESLRGSIYSDTSYGLAFTHSHALVWPYRSTISSPETFSFTLPTPSKNASDPLPLGSLVQASASAAEPGLVIVMPMTGKITYWESVSSAAAMDLIRQQRHGIEGSVGGLLSGETVVQMVSIEPAGFVLRFSSGRIALLSTRDAQRRPAISVQTLRNRGAANGGGGLFGGLKIVFGGGGWRRDVAVVRAGAPSRRAEREFVVATESGIFQIWNVHRGGHYDLRGEADGRQDMMAAMKRAHRKMSSKSEDDLELLDFAFFSHKPSDDDDSSSGDSGNRKLLVLVALQDKTHSSYALLEIVITEYVATVGQVHPIHCYTTKAGPGSVWRPRVLLPEPAHTAFVVFERAVVVSTIAKTPNSPDQQLLADSMNLPEPFEDVVDFREGIDIEIVGCGQEDGRVLDASRAEEVQPPRRRAKDPGCILLVRGGGVLRLSAFEPSLDLKFGRPETVTAKSKIEQAIFFGNDPHNLLNFSGRPEIQFSLEEVEEAALEISREVLSSQSAYLPTVTPSQEQHLKRRSTVLQDLALHLKKTYLPLSRGTKWELLWDAEKMAAARAIWKRYDLHLKQQGSEQTRTLMGDLVEMLHEKFKTVPIEDEGEIDPVRFWFIRDVGRLENIVPWAHNTIAENYKEGQKDLLSMVTLVNQANDVSLGALETAFRFRQENAAVYGLEKEPLKDGVLRGSFEGLPEFWTSTLPIVNTTKMLVDLARELAVRFLEQPSTKEGAPDPDTITKIQRENVRQVEICCQSYIERYSWCLAQDDEEMQNEGAQLRAAHLAVRSVQIGKLVNLGMVDAGVDLAEKYRDMPTLVQLLGGEINDMLLRTAEHGIDEDEVDELRGRLPNLIERFEGYFEKFGDEWARALYKQQIKSAQFSSLLDDNEEHQTYLTRFLRSNPGYSKLSWINDVCGENDLATASNTILGQAFIREKNLWNKKVTLSIGKLAKLAVEGTHPGTRLEEKKTKGIDKELRLVNIQEKLYDLIIPAAHNAIDEKAGVQLAIAKFGSVMVKDKPALSSVLESGLNALIARECLGANRLIDVLTLMDHHYQLEKSSDMLGQEFFHAFEALELIEHITKAQKKLLQKLIWRRCMIRDDWTVINDTQLKDDKAVEQSTGDTALFTTLKAGYKTGFWDDRSSCRPMRPSDILGAGCAPTELRERFPEDMCDAIALDHSREDDQLQRYISKGRLDDWFTGIVDAAKNSVLDDAERETAIAQEKLELEKSIGGTVTVTNGHAEVDEEGDVEMGGTT